MTLVAAHMIRIPLSGSMKPHAMREMGVFAFSEVFKLSRAFHFVDLPPFLARIGIPFPSLNEIKTFSLHHIDMH